MRRLTAFTVVVLLAGRANARKGWEDPKPTSPDTPGQAADKAIAAVASRDDTTLSALARRDEPDPWLVADELCLRAEHDVAQRLARAGPRTDTRALPEYVAARGRASTDRALREVLAGARAALASDDAPRALDLTRDVAPGDDSVVSVDLAFTRGLALRRARRLAESAAALLDAGRRAASLGWLARASDAYHQAGLSAAHDSDFRAALRAWEEGLTILERRGNRAGIARCLGNLGNLHKALGDYPKALSLQERALGIMEELEDRVGAASTLGNIGTVHRSRGDYRRALSCLERSLRLAAELGEDAQVAKTLANLGNIHLLMGDYPKAIEYQERALRIMEDLGERGSVAAIVGNIGTLHHSLGDHARALRYQKSSLRLMEEVGNRAGAAKTLQNIGTILGWLGSYREALSHLVRARAAAEALGDRSGVASALGNMGNIHRSLGNYAEAVSCHERALDLSEQIGDREGVARTLTNLGNLHTSLGDHAGALAYLEKALRMMDEIGNRAGAAATMTNIGVVHEALGNDREAISWYQRALDLSQRLGHGESVAITLGNIGNILVSLGDHEHALSHLEKALRLAEDLGDRATIAWILTSIGSTHRSRGDLALALSYEERALREADAIAERDLTARAHWGLARTHLARGDAAAAIASCRRAVAVLGPLASGLAEEEGARTQEAFARIFELGTSAALALNDLESLCFFIESGRAATLLEALGGRDAMRDAVVPEVLRIEEARARTQETTAYTRYRSALAKGVLQEIREARRRLDDARRRVVGAIERIQRQSRAGADVAFPKAASLKQLRASLAEGDALVCYALSGRNAAALVVTPGGVRAVTLPGEIQAACARLQERVASAPGRAPARGADPAATLAGRIIGPLDLDAGVRRLLISPQGSLSYVPFALVAGAREVVMVPSGTTYRVLRDDRGATGNRVLALGDPDYGSGADDPAPAAERHGPRLSPLPGTRAEVAAVGDEILLGRDASEARFREIVARPTRWRAVHLACHGLVLPDRPRLSSLALASGDGHDGRLTVLDVFRMSIPADLVVLSACETAKGKIYKAEGIIGFTRAFMMAGAPRVIVSLWKVHDEATRALMVRFYGHWNPKDGSNGLPAATALRKAQEHVASHEQWRHPYYWAAWQLWGLGD